MKIKAKRVENIVNELTLEDFCKLYPGFAPQGFASKNLLFVSQTAQSSIDQHIGWGKTTIENINEQGGILIGKPFLIGGKYVSTVEFTILGEATHSNSAYLKMGHETWMKMLDIYDDNYREKGYYIVGWYHTHPNSLSVFMSSTDRNTQRLYFQQDWHFAMVLNPHRRLVAYFNAIDAKECDGYCIRNFAGDRQ